MKSYLLIAVGLLFTAIGNASAQGYNYRSTWRPSPPIQYRPLDPNGYRTGRITTLTAEAIDETGMLAAARQRMEESAAQLKREREWKRQQDCSREFDETIQRIRRNDPAFNQKMEVMENAAEDAFDKMEQQRNRSQELLERFAPKTLPGGPTIGPARTLPCDNLQKFRNNHPEAMHGRYLENTGHGGYHH